VVARDAVAQPEDAAEQQKAGSVVDARGMPSGPGKTLWNIAG